MVNFVLLVVLLLSVCAMVSAQIGAASRCTTLDQCNLRGKCEIFKATQICHCDAGFSGSTCSLEPQELLVSHAVPGGLFASNEVYYVVAKSAYSLDARVRLILLTGDADVYGAIGQVPTSTKFQFTSLGTTAKQDNWREFTVLQDVPLPGAADNDLNLYVTVKGNGMGMVSLEEEASGVLDEGSKIEKVQYNLFLLQAETPFTPIPGMAPATAWTLVIFIAIIIAVTGIGACFWFYTKKMPKMQRERREKVVQMQAMVLHNAANNVDAGTYAGGGGSVMMQDPSMMMQDPSMAMQDPSMMNAGYGGGSFAGTAYGGSLSSTGYGGSMSAGAYPNSGYSEYGEGTGAGGYPNQYMGGTDASAGYGAAPDTSQYAGGTDMSGAAYGSAPETMQYANNAGGGQAQW